MSKQVVMYTVSTYNPDDTVNKISLQAFKEKMLIKATKRYDDLKNKIIKRLIPDTKICILKWYNKYTYSIIDQYSLDGDYDGMKVGDIYSTMKDDKNISC